MKNGADMMKTRLWRRAGIALLPVAMLAGPAMADFKVPAEEAGKLTACEKSVCDLVVKRGPADGKLTCDVSKTWSRSFIEDGVKEKSFKWGLGDARCSIKLDIPRDILVKALSQPDYVLEVPAHTASCDAETGGSVTSVKITLAPELTFKAGNMTAVRLGIGKIDAPAVIKGAIWSAAKIEDSLGLFQKQLVKEINTFVHERCPLAAAGK